MFAVIYRWKLVPGREALFEEGWCAGTEAIAKEFGGWGSRLHRGEDGIVVNGRLEKVHPHEFSTNTTTRHCRPAHRAPAAQLFLIQRRPIAADHHHALASLNRAEQSTMLGRTRHF